MNFHYAGRNDKRDAPFYQLHFMHFQLHFLQPCSIRLTVLGDDILVRPEPDKMDLAYQADECLQELVPTRRILFLRAPDSKVKKTICEYSVSDRGCEDFAFQENDCHKIGSGGAQHALQLAPLVANRLPSASV